MLDDGLPTPSSVEQQQLEQRIVQDFYADDAPNSPQTGLHELLLHREDHVEYLLRGLQTLPAGFIALDASRPWICYWILHSLALLDRPLQADDTPSPDTVVDFLTACQHPQGGFGGGPQQLPHLATTYAAVAALVTIGGSHALHAIDRRGLKAFLQSRCVPLAHGGGMSMHDGGEVDVRGCYTAIAAAHMTGIDIQDLAARGGLVDFIKRCQTYEGGLGGEPDNEAHGGYTYCGTAALLLLGEVEVLDIPRLLHWLVFKQGVMEGGFAGRTNKLVDGCYTFWQGALVPLIHALGPAFFAQTGPLGPPVDSSAAGQGVSGRGTVTPATTQDNAQPQQQSQPQQQAREQAEPVLQGMAAGIEVHPLPALPQQFDPGRQACAAETRVQALLHGSTTHEFPAHVPPPQSLPLRLETLLATTTHHRQWLQHSALVLSDDATRACIAMDSQEGTPVHGADGDKSQVHGATDGGGGQGVHAETQGVDDTLCNTRAVQLWVLQCCQAARGGLRDKPGKGPDYYHSCYCLSGLSAMQHYGGYVVGGERNRLKRADLLCNVLELRVAEAKTFFNTT